MPSSYLYLNELRYHYMQWGRGSGGRPLLLLHGLASNARIWELIAPNLAAAGFELLALDLRGHGLTDRPDGDYGFDTFARDLRAFIDAHELERPVLVGHSWGALLALDYAARLPVGPRSPSGLVLVDGGMFQLDDGQGATWEQTRDRLTPPRLDGTPVDQFLAMLNARNLRWQPDEQSIQIILANFEIDEQERISPRLSFEHHMQIVRAMWEFKTYERMARLSCPLLMVPARPAAPYSSQELEFFRRKEQGLERSRQIAAHLKVHWMKDTIHDIPLQRPAELAEVIANFAHNL